MVVLDSRWILSDRAGADCSFVHHDLVWDGCAAGWYFQGHLARVFRGWSDFSLEHLLDLVYHLVVQVSQEQVLQVGDTVRVNHMEGQIIHVTKI